MGPPPIGVLHPCWGLTPDPDSWHGADINRAFRGSVSEPSSELNDHIASLRLQLSHVYEEKHEDHASLVEHASGIRDLSGGQKDFLHCSEAQRGRSKGCQAAAAGAARKAPLVDAEKPDTVIELQRLLAAAQPGRLFTFRKRDFDRIPGRPQPRCVVEAPSQAPSSSRPSAAPAPRNRGRSLSAPRQQRWADPPCAPQVAVAVHNNNFSGRGCSNVQSQRGRSDQRQEQSYPRSPDQRKRSRSGGRSRSGTRRQRGDESQFPQGPPATVPAPEETERRLGLSLGTLIQNQAAEHRAAAVAAAAAADAAAAAAPARQQPAVRSTVERQSENRPAEPSPEHFAQLPAQHSTLVPHTCDVLWGSHTARAVLAWYGQTLIAICNAHPPQDMNGARLQQFQQTRALSVESCRDTISLVQQLSSQADCVFMTGPALSWVEAVDPQAVATMAASFASQVSL